MAQAPSLWTDSIPNQSPRLVIVCIVFLVFTTAIVCTRIVWRWVHRQRGWDDVMAICAYIILLIQTIFGGVSAHYGFGKHKQDIHPTLTKSLMFFYLYQICYKLLGGSTKLTFCFLYLRIFNQKWFRRLVIAIATIVAAGSLAYTFGTIFTCDPVPKAWNRKIPGTCTSNIRFWFSHAAFNTFFDMVIYILPIPMIRTLKLASGQRTGLISIFSLGAFVIAASIVRMVMLRGSAKTTDPTWGSMEALVWTEIEANTSVIICCLPALRVPFLNVWHWMRGRDRRPPTPPQMVRAQREEYAWSGPHQGTAEAHHGPTRPSRTYRPRNKGGSDNSRSGGSKTVESWYERVLQSISRGEKQAEPSSPSRTSSHEEMMRVETDIPSPEAMEDGQIYRRTDVHVSTTQLRKDSEPEDDESKGKGREMSLQDFLNDRS